MTQKEQLDQQLQQALAEHMYLQQQAELLQRMHAREAAHTEALKQFVMVSLGTDGLQQRGVQSASNRVPCACDAALTSARRMCLSSSLIVSCPCLCVLQAHRHYPAGTPLPPRSQQHLLLLLQEPVHPELKLLPDDWLATQVVNGYMPQADDEAGGQCF